MNEELCKHRVRGWAAALVVCASVASSAVVAQTTSDLPATVAATSSTKPIVTEQELLDTRLGRCAAWFFMTTGDQTEPPRMMQLGVDDKLVRGSYAYVLHLSLRELNGATAAAASACRSLGLAADVSRPSTQLLISGLNGLNDFETSQPPLQVPGIRDYVDMIGYIADKEWPNMLQDLFKADISVRLVRFYNGYEGRCIAQFQPRTLEMYKKVQAYRKGVLATDAKELVDYGSAMHKASEEMAKPLFDDVGVAGCTPKAIVGLKYDNPADRPKHYVRDTPMRQDNAELWDMRLGRCAARYAPTDQGIAEKMLRGGKDSVRTRAAYTATMHPGISPKDLKANTDDACATLGLVGTLPPNSRFTYWFDGLLTMYEESNVDVQPQRLRKIAKENEALVQRRMIEAIKRENTPEALQQRKAAEAAQLALLDPVFRISEVMKRVSPACNQQFARKAADAIIQIEQYRRAMSREQLSDINSGANMTMRQMGDNFVAELRVTQCMPTAS